MNESNAQYLVTTPSSVYNGIAYGIRFQNGRAVVSTHTLNQAVGLDVAHVVLGMINLGYHVEKIGTPDVVDPAPKARANRAARNA